MSGRPRFDAALDALPRYELGAPIDITFLLTNSSDCAYQVLTWGSPLDVIESNFLVVRSEDGDRLPYDGRYVTRRNPSPAAYVTLAPGETVTSAFDVARSYPIKAAGRYSIELDARLRDAIELSGSGAAPPRNPDNYAPVALERATVTIEVTGAGDPALTIGERDRGAPGPPQLHVPEGDAVDLASAVARPQIIGGTSEQRETIYAAHDFAVELCLLCGDQLTNNATSNALYEIWFGPYDEARWRGVARNYLAIASYLLTTQVIYDTESPECRAGIIAFTTEGTNKVSLCQGFWDEHMQNTDSQWGTLIHEWTHAVCGTEDHEYGTRATRILAKNDVRRAANNAENYQYCAELLPPAWTAGRLINQTDTAGSRVGAAAFNDKLYLFWLAATGPGGSIQYTASDNGMSWPASKTVGSETTNRAPAAMAFKGKLHLFFAASTNTGILWSSSEDGTTWTPSTTIGTYRRSVTGLALAVYDDKLYVFWTGDMDDTIRYATTSDGLTWNADLIVNGNAHTRWGPGAGIVNKKLAVFWQDKNDAAGRIAYTASSDGSTWPNPQSLNNHDTADFEVAAADYQGVLYLLWKAPSSGRLWLTASADGVRWPDSHSVNDADTTATSMTAVVYGGSLYVFFVVTGTSKRLAYSKLTLPVPSKYGT